LRSSWKPATFEWHDQQAPVTMPETPIPTNPR